MPPVTIVDPHAEVRDEDVVRAPRPGLLPRYRRPLAVVALGALAAGVVVLVQRDLEERALDRAAARAVSVYLLDQALEEDELQLLNQGTDEVTVTGLQLEALGFTTASLRLPLAPDRHADVLVDRGFRCQEQALAVDDLEAVITVRTTRGTTVRHRTDLDAGARNTLLRNLRRQCGFAAGPDALTVASAQVRGGRTALLLVNQSAAPVTVTVDGLPPLAVPAREKAWLSVATRLLTCRWSEDGRFAAGLSARAGSRFGEGPIWLTSSELDPGRCWDQVEDGGWADY